MARARGTLSHNLSAEASEEKHHVVVAAQLTLLVEFHIHIAQVEVGVQALEVCGIFFIVILLKILR